MTESNEQSLNELTNIEDLKNVNVNEKSSDKFNDDSVLENDKDSNESLNN